MFGQSGSVFPTTRDNYNDKEKINSDGGEYKEIGVLPPEMVYTSIGLKRHYTPISKEKVKIIHCPKPRTSGSSYEPIFKQFAHPC